MEFDFSSEKPKRRPPPRLGKGLSHSKGASESSREKESSIRASKKEGSGGSSCRMVFLRIESSPCRHVIPDPVVDLPVAFTEESATDVVGGMGMGRCVDYDDSSQWNEAG